jgi:hypothetical protein
LSVLDQRTRQFSCTSPSRCSCVLQPAALRPVFEALRFPPLTPIPDESSVSTFTSFSSSTHVYWLIVGRHLSRWSPRIPASQECLKCSKLNVQYSTGSFVVPVNLAI